MKIIAVNYAKKSRLYSKEDGGYTVAVFDQSQKTSFSLDSNAKLQYAKFNELSPLDQDGIKWAEDTIATGDYR